MSVTVDFSHTFNKKENSCDLPVLADWSGTANCVLKSGTSIVNPVIVLDRAAFDTYVSQKGRPTYAKISDFDGRYYFIGDIVYQNATVEITLICDVLATYKTEISNSKQYILRSSNNFNTYLPDTMYPAQSNTDYGRTTVPHPWVSNFTSGSVIFGVAGSGATTYYLMSYNDFGSFIRYLMSDSYAASVIGAYALSSYPQYKMVVDPLQYITSLMWIPLGVATLTGQSNLVSSVSSIDVGAVTVAFSSVGSISGYEVTNGVYRYTTSLATAGINPRIPTHPSTTARGQYLNCGPWTQMQLHVSPFGLLDIDMVKLGLYQASASVIVWMQITIDVDIRTGTGTLVVYRFKTDANGQNAGDAQMLTRINSQVGIVFEIGQVIAPGYGVSSAISQGASIVSDIAGVGANIAVGNVAGAVQGAASAVQSVVSGIGDIIRSQIPMAKTIGGTGGKDALAESWGLDYQFFMQTQEARAEIGRAYCQEDYIYNQQGFVLCRDAHGAFGRTLEEKQRIINYMNTGFFYGEYTSP